MASPSLRWYKRELVCFKMSFSISMSKGTLLFLLGIIFCISINSCFGTKIYLKPILSHPNPTTLVSLGKLQRLPEKRTAPMMFPLSMYETQFQKLLQLKKPKIFWGRAKILEGIFIVFPILDQTSKHCPNLRILILVPFQAY